MGRNRLFQARRRCSKYGAGRSTPHSIADELWIAEQPLRFFAHPGSTSSAPNLKFTAILGDDPPAAWANEMNQTFMTAFPPLNGIVFFHRKTRTLIFADLLFNIARHDSAYGRLLLRLGGAFRGPAIPRPFRLLLRRWRSECAAFLNQLLLWDFGRVNLAHGEMIDSGAQPAVERAWRFA